MWHKARSSTEYVDTHMVMLLERFRPGYNYKR